MLARDDASSPEGADSGGDDGGDMSSAERDAVEEAAAPALVEALIAQGAAIGDLSAFIATSFSGSFTPESTSSFALSSMGAIGALRFGRYFDDAACRVLAGCAVVRNMHPPAI